MSSQNIVFSKSFTPSSLSISSLSTLKSGAKSAYLNYNKGGFVIQTPSCVLPAGMSVFEEGAVKKHSLQLSLRDYETPGKMKEFYDMLTKLDEFMIEQGIKNSKEWFGKQFSPELIREDKYKPCIRVSKNLNKDGVPYPPSLRVALKTNENGSFILDNVVRKNMEKISDRSFEEIFGRNSKVTCLLKCSGVWVSSVGYGLTWKPIQVRVDEESASNAVYAIQDDEEENGVSSSTTNMVDDDEVFTPAPAPVQVAKPSAVAAVMAAAEEEDEDEDDTVEAVPVPKKTTTVVKKPTIVKKK